MNSLSNFSKQFAIPVAFVLVANFSAQAQSPVESTHVDEKYAYTTVVYKTTAASDKEVLTALENDFGIGDVVRVTLAPLPAPISAIPASEPVYADKSKGEDSWLPATARSSENMTVSTSPTAATKLPVKSVATSPKPVAAASTVAAPKVLVAKPAATEMAKKPEAAATAPVQMEKAVVAPVVSAAPTNVKVKTAATGKTAKAHKAAKKSGKKSSHNARLKNRKSGKQRYACPKF